MLVAQGPVLSEVDIATATVKRSVTLAGGDGFAVDAARGTVWFTDIANRRMHRVDTATFQVTATLELPAGEGFGGFTEVDPETGAVWVGLDTSVVVHDAAGKRLGVIQGADMPRAARFDAATHEAFVVWQDAGDTSQPGSDDNGALTVHRTRDLQEAAEPVVLPGNHAQLGGAAVAVEPGGGTVFVSDPAGEDHPAGAVHVPEDHPGPGGPVRHGRDPGLPDRGGGGDPAAHRGLAGQHGRGPDLAGGGGCDLIDVRVHGCALRQRPPLPGGVHQRRRRQPNRPGHAHRHLRGHHDGRRPVRRRDRRDGYGGRNGNDRRLRRRCGGSGGSGAAGGSDGSSGGSGGTVGGASAAGTVGGTGTTPTGSALASTGVAVASLAGCALVITAAGWVLVRRTRPTAR
ncbi:hypothetical protein WKI68_06500 [Streptomyces sp. MS1.HAVA.3]|uniref:SMP-30/Gluconolactonase/LRE-like region domain-containing protein n=1 Tax=Streptomyces caledonius TaxID=3134107 RepID=A0ABU8U133_9ACTN